MVFFELRELKILTIPMDSSRIVVAPRESRTLNASPLA